MPHNTENSLPNPNLKFPYKLVGLGGCFDRIHEGHFRLLETAFKLGEHVAIGLSTENLLKDKAFREKIQPYSVRKKQLTEYIKSTLQISPDRFSIIQLTDPFGPAITEPNLEAHVSSVETHFGALKINEYRVKNGLKPLVLVIIPMVNDASGNKISSSTIREKI
jgi:pantetheine-phosphate adenylyltransferase